MPRSGVINVDAGAMLEIIDARSARFVRNWVERFPRQMKREAMVGVPAIHVCMEVPYACTLCATICTMRSLDWLTHLCRFGSLASAYPIFECGMQLACYQSCQASPPPSESLRGQFCCRGPLSSLAFSSPLC